MTDASPASAPDQTFDLNGASGVPVVAYRWLPSSAPRAAVMVVHGMAEHALRYGRLARVLTDAGYVVYGIDLRGHGATGTRQGLLGHFADEAGWRQVVADLSILRTQIGGEQPGLPVLMFAHSMGSFLGQDYLIHHGHTLAGVIFSATSGGNGPTLLVGEAVALAERRRLGPRSQSALLQRLALGDPCKAFRPCRTESDWLSRDESEVDKYVADPLCGFQLTTQSWLDFTRGLKGIEVRHAQASVPKALPVLMLAGDVDPVGRGGKGPRWLQARYRGVGMQDVELKLYPGARHEVINEINRDEVHQDVLNFYRRLV